MYKRALDVGVKIQLASKVVEYNPATPSIKVEDGLTYEADLVVAADGEFRDSDGMDT